MGDQNQSQRRSKLAEWAPTILSAIVFLVGGVIFYLVYEAPYKMLALGSSTVEFFETIQPGIEVRMHKEWPYDKPEHVIDIISSNRANYAVKVKNVGKLRCRIALKKAEFARCRHAVTYVFDDQSRLTTKVLGGKLNAHFDLLPGQESKQIYTIEFEDIVPDYYCLRFIFISKTMDYVKKYIQQLAEDLGHQLSDEFFTQTYTLSMAIRPPPKKPSPAKQ